MTAAPTTNLEIQKGLIRQARRATWALVLTVLAGFLGGVLVVTQARLVSQVVAGVFLDNQTLNGVAWLLELLLGVIGLRAALVLLAESSARRSARTIKQGLQLDLFDRLLALGPAYARANRSGELATTLIAGIEALDAYFSQYLPQLALAALVPLTILLAVFPIDWLSGVVLLLTAPLTPIFMVLIGSQSEALTRRQWGELSRLGAHFLDTLQGLAALKALGQSQARAGSIASASEAYRQRTMAVLRVTFLSALVLELVGTISTAVVAVEIGLRLLAGGIDYRQALFILILAPEFFLPLRNLGLRFHAGVNGVSAARRIFEILSNEAGPRGIIEPVPAVSQAVGAAHPAQPIHFENVSFTYPGADTAALRDLTFTIPPGGRAALVGSSGAGKSSLMNLLLRFSEPTAGSIRLGETPLASLPASSWRRQVAWAPQSPYLFNDTLAANLCLGRPGASRMEIENALAFAHLDGFVAALPDGLKTRLGEGGVRLSGGQAQRLALARAYLKDAPYLFLDEPGANLDPEQEAFMLAALETLCQGRSVVTIAHRLATMRTAGLILVLDEGCLVESGTHADLLARGGVYTRLVSAGVGAEGDSL